MLRKTQLTAAALLSACFASPSFSGVYVGAAVGPEGGNFSQEARVIIPSTINVVDRNHFSGLGVFGSIFAGYGRDFNRFNLAAEINANLTSLEHILTNDEYVHQTFSKTTFRISNSEGISLLPGFSLTDDTLLYGRVGYSNARLKIHESDPTIRSMKENVNGIRYGVGIRHALTPAFAFMMDYSQINYQHVRSTVAIPPAGLTKITKIRPDTAQLALGFIYSFDKPVLVDEK